MKDIINKLFEDQIEDILNKKENKDIQNHQLKKIIKKELKKDLSKFKLLKK